MTTRLVHRPARVVQPQTTEPPLVMSPPPTLPEGKTASGLQGLIPLVGSVASMSMMMFMRGSQFAGIGAVLMVVSLSAGVLFYFTQRGKATRQRREQRERYMDYLEELREELRDHERDSRTAAIHRDPPAAHLVDLINDPARLWERRRTDEDFLHIRLGIGALPSREIQLRVEGTPTNPTDVFLTQEANSLRRRFASAPGLPLRVPLDRAGDISVIGADREDVLAVARALLMQVTALHAPDDVTVVVFAAREREQDWAWARWLPHLLDRQQIGPLGPIPRLVPDKRILADLLAADLSERGASVAKAYRYGGASEEARVRPRLLVIDDAYGQVAHSLPLPDQAQDLPGLGVTVVHLLADRLHEPGDITHRISVEKTTISVENPSVSSRIDGTLDEMPVALAEGVARQLAPLRLSPDSYDDGSGIPPADFTSLLGLSDPADLNLRQLWKPRRERDFLRIPLGITSAGRPLLLDLKESAQLGMGPHGLCVGATGSGKSELLRTLVLALVTSHSPQQLSMVLVDYKGGATFAPFSDLPHVAGLITNLASDVSLVERMYASLDGEVLRRQQVLADAGRLTDITAYNLRRAELGNPADMPPLPHLMVIIDEFGELLTAKPEFIELFLRIGRIGRSIGVHLLLSSQRIEEGKLRGLETYLSYRIGLRTLSETESRTVLDTPDAFHLPSLPGNGYLKVDVTVYEKFKAAFVSSPLEQEETEVESAPFPGPRVKPMPRFALPVDEPAAEETSQPAPRTTGPTLLSTVVEQLNSAGGRVPPIWLPPLPSAVTLDQAAHGFDVTPHGVRLRVAPPGTGLHVLMGLLDDPARQWQGPWSVDLSAEGGNLLLVGGPASGKTTALRTLALGLAATYTPTDVGIYGIDLFGNGLRPLSELPHVGGIAGRDDRQRIRRTIDELHAMLAERERLFSLYQLDTVENLHAERAAGRLTELPCTEIVLLLDGYGQLFAEFESLEASLHDLIARGARYGIHIAATARRFNEVRSAQQVAFAQRIELRLTEPGESSIDGKLARGIPTKTPGRALTTGNLYAQVALPRLDALPDPTTSGLQDAATTVRGAWTGPLPPQIRVLPAILGADELPAPGEVPGIALGIFESDFSPAAADLFGPDQNLLALGDSGTGKTNLLRLVADTLISRYSPGELVFAVFDPRSGLAGAVPEPYLGGYATNPTVAQQLSMAVCKELAQRDPASSRSNARPPRIVLLIDDYDMLTASATQPLGEFAQYLPAGRDLGLHVVMARRVMGASRGLYEPFTLAVRESGCLGLLFSGDRMEGQLFTGVRATTLPVGRALYVRPSEPARTIQTAYFAREQQPKEAR
ncbi:type VII secretion protein EccCa [Amycolatopsis rhizosphaerae]|uniref:Type VII secretion protein EccCa n=1 Tax=Amycolatopsis rhizosphaerae TaxID=2053003 RepID=A0A558DKV3_9PSEU|nr:type VII secretion protein EccCa [Amycolatopsis rhizosphaerae]TVT61602.1 type VII secretion protein EccCa [Amycolatopsis rhizosphaerae]